MMSQWEGITLKEINIGIIGAGTIARYHIQGLRHVQQAHLTAVADQERNAAMALAKEENISRVYDDPDALLQDPEIQAVIIATPPAAHASLVLKALRAGKHVLCEKPPAINYAQAEECRRAAVAADRVLMYGFIRRFSREIRALHRLLTDNDPGTFVTGEVYRLDRCSQARGWFVDKSIAGGGVLLDGCIHELDAALYLLGYPAVKTVDASTSNWGRELPQQLGADAGYAPRENKPYTHTVETSGSARLRFFNGGCLHVHAASVLFTVRQGTCIDLCFEKLGLRLENGHLTLIENRAGFGLCTIHPDFREPVDDWAQQEQHFVDCCLGLSRCIPNAGEGAKLMRIMDAVYTSAANEEPIQFS